MAKIVINSTPKQKIKPKYNSFDEAITRINDMSSSNSMFNKTFEIFIDLINFKLLDADKIIIFFDLVRTKFDENWILFLLKTYRNLGKLSSKLHSQTYMYIHQYCKQILVDLEINTKHADEDFIREISIEEMEEFFKNVEKSIREKRLGYKFNNHKVAMLCYLWIMICNNVHYSTNYSDKLIPIERAFIEFFSKFSDDKNRIETYCCKRIVDALEKSDFDSNIKNYGYLYYDTTHQINVLNKNISSYKTANFELKNRIEQKENQIRDQQHKIVTLETQITIQNELINKTQTEKNKVEDMFDFEINKIEKQFETLKKGLFTDFRKSINLELEGIRDIIDFVNASDKSKIERRLNRIEDFLNQNLKG